MTTSDLPTIHRASLEAAIARLKADGVEITPADEHGIGNGMLSPVRAAMIRTEYAKLRSDGEKYGNTVRILADKYCLALVSVRAIVDVKN